MKSQCYWDENSICYYPNMFKTVEFLDRNGSKKCILELINKYQSLPGLPKMSKNVKND